jgi:hypothetical protein
MEQKAEKLFRKYKTQYIAKLGRHALNNTEIDTFAKSTFGTRYKGSFAQDEKFELKSGFYIINTDIRTGPGIHWISLVLTPKTAFIYDSFARSSKSIVSHLVKRLTKANRKIVCSDRTDKEQRDIEIVCGHLSLAFLAVAKDLGIRAAIKI